MPGRDKNLTPRAREMRTNATRQEDILWYDYLSKYPLRFYRQKIIWEYIVDFYCPKARLVIELDGNQHLLPESAAYDEERTKILEAKGLRVMRFPNHMLQTQFYAVCRAIDDAVKESAHSA